MSVKNYNLRKRNRELKLPECIWINIIFLFSNRPTCETVRYVSKLYKKMVEKSPVWISFVEYKIGRSIKIDHISSILSSTLLTPYKKYLQATFKNVQENLFYYFSHFLVIDYRFDCRLIVQKNGILKWEGKSFDDLPYNLVKFYNKCVRQKETEFLKLWIGRISKTSKIPYCLDDYFPTYFEHLEVNMTAQYLINTFVLESNEKEEFYEINSMDNVKSFCQRYRIFNGLGIPIFLAIRLYCLINWMKLSVFHPSLKNLPFIQNK